MKAIAILTHDIDENDMDSVDIVFGIDWKTTVNAKLCKGWAEEDLCEENQERAFKKLGDLPETEAKSLLENRTNHWLSKIKWKEDKDHFHGDYICSKGKDVGEFTDIAVTVRDIPKEENS